MSTSCESVARHILPLYRSLVAKELLSKYNYTQVEAAKKLGTTQAAVSQYVTAKRGRKGIQNYNEIAPFVKSAATKAAKRIATKGMNTKEFNASFCELCRYLQAEKSASDYSI